MNNWGANHGAISYGHIGADLITLCSMLRIPVSMHNVASDRMKEMNYIFAIHDQYRDYYFDANTYDTGILHDFPGRKETGFLPLGRRMADIHLCKPVTTLPEEKLYRTFPSGNPSLEGTYLDVFTCNEPDECAHPWHTMTRKECLEYRKNCFDFLNANDIIASSRRQSTGQFQSCDSPLWSVLIYGGRKRFDSWGSGSAVCTVYHDCMVLPWMMDADKPGGDHAVCTFKRWCCILKL